MKKYILPVSIVFFLQIFLSNLISIRGIRPDFVVILMVYFALEQGSLRGVVFGFLSGLIISIFDNSAVLGVLSLSYSIIGYGIGLLKDYKRRISPYQFNLIVLSIVVFAFFIYNYFNYDAIFYNDLPMFLLYLLRSMVYTISLLIIAQFIIPLRK
jgi:rod shape-determining protein MreD